MTVDPLVAVVMVCGEKKKKCEKKKLGIKKKGDRLNSLGRGQ